MRESIDLSPHKEVYKSASADVDPVSAIKELVDNALDNWERVSRRMEPLKIQIDKVDDVLIVKDDSGGLSPSDINMLFALGVSTKEEEGGTIGAYGIGSKKAIVRLGRRATLKSRGRRQEAGYGFRVDEEWLNDDTNWSVEREEFPEMEEGTTEIVIGDLKVDWEDLKDDLVRDLGNTYELFLRRYGKRLSLSVGEDAIEAPEGVDWTYTPFSALHPRRFEGIELDHQDLSAPVTMAVTVGLMRTADGKKAGTDFYCQGRKIIEAAQDERGGFKSTAKGGIGVFRNPHDARLRVLVELETDGDAADLPWDSQKSDIDTHNVVTHMVHDWLRKIVKPYFRAKASDIPKAAVHPYDSTHEYAANNGNVEVLDYSNRDRVTDRPDTSFEDIEKIREKAEADAQRGRKDTESLAEWQLHLYNTEYERFREKRIGETEEEDSGAAQESASQTDRADFRAQGTLTGREEEKTTVESGVESGNEVSVPVKLSKDDLDKLRDFLNLSEDAEKDEIGGALGKRLERFLF